MFNGSWSSIQFHGTPEDIGDFTTQPTRRPPYNYWLVVSTPLKNISQLGLLFPIYGNIKFMFQTTNQILYIYMEYRHILYRSL